MSTSESGSPFGGQVFKQRNRVAGNTGNSTFDETSDEKLEIPDIDGIMQEIDKSLSKSEEIKVQPIVVEVEQIEVRRGPCCWSDV